MGCAVVLCAAFAVALGLAAPACAEPNVAAANAAMAAIVRNAGAPGGSLAVADHGRLIDVQGFGFANVAARTPVGPDTMFALASCSKQITAMAIMKLVDNGRVTLRTPAFAFLGLNAVADPRSSRITIEQLLNHWSGLPHDVPAKTGDPMNTARAAASTMLTVRARGSSTVPTASSSRCSTTAATAAARIARVS